ncbi:RNA polymerase sigma-70 factor [Solitalea koreensis]|uniref:RNA polymerase sigma-70 factor, ECF subfamily n=1 Tax=Solitalea koreensis TaxID=543615 RepID=A0A521DT37_9SPHI|nr:RNA polymerase sigma-70 factor [Solitalea koreensis]SMO74879.1 RNA polymerase sigma-70 factor, ECF subfamily [Solitalea koreensis]
MLEFEERFKTLFHQHFKRLCQFSFNIVKDEDVAKDIVQELFMKLWNLSNSDKLEEKFEPYAYTAVKNLSLNYLRTRETYHKYQDQLTEDTFSFDPFHEQATLNQKELFYIKLLAAIDKLPEQRRKIFLLSNVDGLKYSEIADQLGISINTVKTQIKLAYQFLRAEFNFDTPLVFVIIRLLKKK